MRVARASLMLIVGLLMVGGVALIIAMVIWNLRPSSIPVLVAPQPATSTSQHGMNISSSMFGQGQAIPSTYTCHGAGKHPPLKFSDVPSHAVSLALVVNDPDAPSGDFVHWVIWNIDPKIGAINEGQIPSGAIQGRSSAGTNAWVPPCPPSGSHRYIFTLYAFDEKVALEQGASREMLHSATNGHVIATATLTGVFTKQ